MNGVNKQRNVVMAIFMFALLPAIAAAIPSLEFAGDTERSGPGQVLCESNLAYVTVANGLTVFDISDPGNIIKLDEVYITSGWYNDIKKSGDYVYLPGHAGLFIVDVSDPTDLLVVGTFPMAHAANAIGIIDSIAYCTYGDLDAAGLYTLNIRDASNIVELDHDSLAGASNFILIHEDSLYISLYGEIGVFSLANNSNPELITTFQVGYYEFLIDEMVIRDSLLHCACHASLQPTGRAAYVICNIADLQNPYIVDKYYFKPCYAADIRLAGDIAYVGATTQGLMVFDISDPANIDSIGSLPFDHCRSITFGDDVLAAVDRSANGKFVTVDISDPTQPSIIGEHSFPSQVTRVASHSGYIYALSEEGSPDVAVLETSFDDSREPVSRYSTQSGAARATAQYHDDTLIIGCAGGLEVVDISDPANLQYVRSYTTANPVYDLIVANGYAYAAARFYIEIFDISDPADNRLAYIPTGAGYFLALQDTLLYISDVWTGVYIYNVSDPANPAFIREFHGHLPIQELRIADSMLYAGSSVGFGIYDFSDPINPVYMRHYFNAGFNYGMEIVKDFAYLSDGYDGLRVIDIADIYNPFEFDWYNTPGVALYTITVGDSIYLADQHSVIKFVFQTPTDAESDPPVTPQFVLEQNAPNPFNPATTIRFSLERSAQTELAVYNILGEQVATLLDSYLPAGDHRVVWDGRDDAGKRVATGVYLYRLMTGDYTQSRKMLLLK